jgi:hypothetical protein
VRDKKILNRVVSGGLSKSGVTHGERVKALIFVRSAFDRQWETEKVGVQRVILLGCCLRLGTIDCILYRMEGVL